MAGVVESFLEGVAESALDSLVEVVVAGVVESFLEGVAEGVLDSLVEDGIEEMVVGVVEGEPALSGLTEAAIVIGRMTDIIMDG